MNEYFVYILANKTNSTLYVGVTNDVARRLYEHCNGVNDGFTKKYKVHKLVFVESTPDVQSAIQREKQLKGLTRDKKEALIDSQNPKWEDLGEKYGLLGWAKHNDEERQ